MKAQTQDKVSASKEHEILTELLAAEKSADAILEGAKKESDSIIHNAMLESAKIASAAHEDSKKDQQNQMEDFQKNLQAMKDAKIREAKKVSAALLSKSEKNTNDTVDFIIKKFEEMINAKTPRYD